MRGTAPARSLQLVVVEFVAGVDGGLHRVAPASPTHPAGVTPRNERVFAAKVYERRVQRRRGVRVARRARVVDGGD